MVKIIIPIDSMDEERWDRYKPQFIPLSKNLDELYICAEKGYEPKENVKNIFFYFFKHKNKPRRIVDMPDEIKSFNRIIRKIRSMKKFAKMIKKIDVDLIYGLSASGFLQFAHIEMKKIKKIPAIYRMRGHGINERKFKQNFPIKEVNNALDAYTTSKYDLHIPIKREYIDVLLKRGIDKNRICEPIINGVDVNLFKPIKTPSELTIGYAGRISNEKGIDFLSLLMNCTKNISYQIAGKEQMKWNIPDNCRYLGILPHKKMVNFYNSCNLIVLPSYSEGVSNVILEAYACGRVLIMSKNAHPPEIPNFGWELPHDIKEWKKLIESLDADKLSERGCKAREWVKKCSWDEYGKKMVAQFKKVVKE